MRFGWLAAVAALVPAVPAQAVVYTGKLKGVITSGSAFYNDYSKPEFRSDQIDLKGKIIEISFQTDVRLNYFDPIYEDFYEQYNVTDISSVLNIPSPLTRVGGRLDSVIYGGPSQTASYNGDSQAARLAVDGPLDVGRNDSYSLDMTFAGAGRAYGPVQGSGRTLVQVFFFGQGMDFFYDANFTITEGVVFASVPEPATWGLMIGGIGMAAGALRRRRRLQSVACLA